MLPEYEQARKAIWDAVNPHTGIRRIDEAFPEELRKSTDKQRMKIEFKSGSIWQVVGSDNFNSLLGSPPIGCVYSEWAVADPMALAYLSPIFAENNGWQLFIYTARGYNHGYSTWDGARKDSTAFAELLTVDDTQAITKAALAQVLRNYVELYGEEHGHSLWRQEFYNDWSAANIGAVLGTEIERADRERRISDDIRPDDWAVEISSDIGFRDTAAWWFWQPRQSGFDLIDYDQGIGLDADDWIERLKNKPYKLGKIWLPHDARAKTFQSKHSAVERFLQAFGSDKVAIVPQGKVSDRINAARRIAKSCRFHRTNCKDGLNGLRSWSFKYDEEKKIYSKDPDHNWASHPGDAFSYGAQVLSERIIEVKKQEPMRGITVGVPSVTLEEMWAEAGRRRERI